MWYVIHTFVVFFSAFVLFLDDIEYVHNIEGKSSSSPVSLTIHTDYRTSRVWIAMSTATWTIKCKLNINLIGSFVGDETNTANLGLFSLKD